MKKIRFFVSAMAMTLLSSSAIAAIVTAVGTTRSYNFTTTQVPEFPATGPYGTVTLTQQGAGSLVQVNVSPNFVFANTGGGYAFAFNLDPLLVGESINLSLLDAPLYTVGPAPANQNPYGNFTNAITKNSPGTSGIQDNFLEFIVTMADIDNFLFLSTASTRPTHPGGFLFSADLGFLQNGQVVGTGTVAADEDDRVPPTGLPEPTSFALLGLGLAAIGFGRRRMAKKS